MNAPNAEFDRYSEHYDELLYRALNASGEGPEYYARGRVAWFARKLREFGLAPRSILNFGCGTGNEAPWLMRLTGASRVVGLDISAESVAIARQRHTGAGFEFYSSREYSGGEEFDAAYCNGVFHHILPAQRPGALKSIGSSVRTGALFALWENNPWNPGTRYVMSRCEFDGDAIMLKPREAEGLLRSAGFQVVGTSFMFIFPRPLKFLRGLERRLARLPLGGQYQALGIKR